MTTTKPITPPAEVRELAERALSNASVASQNHILDEGHEQADEVLCEAVKDAVAQAIMADRASRAPQGQVAVKPLEWHGPSEGVCWAESAIGTYSISTVGGDWWLRVAGSVRDERIGTINEAKAAAQADYASRTQTEAQPAGQSGEREGRLLSIITQAQDVLAEYIIPDSGISDFDCVNRLLSILDNQDTVRFLHALSHPDPVTIPHERLASLYDGFEGDVIGHYVTREGKDGVVVQQDGTRVVHVYSRKSTKTPEEKKS